LINPQEQSPSPKDEGIEENVSMVINLTTLISANSVDFNSAK
jgi:hypothetical protein